MLGIRSTTNKNMELEKIIRKHIKDYYGFDSIADKLTMPLSRVIPMMKEFKASEDARAIEIRAALDDLVNQLKPFGYYTLDRAEAALKL